MPNAHHAPGGMSMSTKIGLGIAVVVAIVAILYYSPDGVSFGNVFGGGFEDVFEPSGSGEKMAFSVSSSQSLIEDEFGINNATVSVSGRNRADLSVGDAAFANSGKDADVEFRGFQGKVTVGGGSITVDGTATMVVLDGSGIKPKAKTFIVSAQMAPDAYSIDKISVKDLMLAGVTGSIERAGEESSRVTLSNSTLKISDFDGSVELKSGGYVLAGASSRIEGKSFTLKG